MTANLSFQIGKYLNNKEYQKGIFYILESIEEIEIVNITIVFTHNYGLKKDDLTVAEAIAFILLICEQTDNMPDEAKTLVRELYLEANPEDRE